MVRVRSQAVTHSKWFLPLFCLALGGRLLPLARLMARGAAASKEGRSSRMTSSRGGVFDNVF